MFPKDPIELPRKEVEESEDESEQPLEASTDPDLSLIHI